MFDLSNEQVRAGLRRMFDHRPISMPHCRRTGGELLELATRDPDTFRRALQPTTSGALATDAVAAVKARASRTLSTQLAVAPGDERFGE